MIIKHLSVLLLICLTSFAFATDKGPYTAIYDRVIQPNADHAALQCTNMETALQSNDKQLRLNAFVNLTKAWAKVKATYVLGGYDMDAMDYPFLIDYFHMGNENIHQTLQRIIDSDTKASTALYKNSYKTLIALDDVMFSGPWSARRQALAKVITGTVCSRIAAVQKGYKTHRDDFLKNKDKALSLLVNAEIESIYKTRDWRIGQLSGLTKKTLGQTFPEKQQYPYSKATWATIGAILDTHEQLLASDKQPNVATIAHAKQGDKSMTAVQQALAASLNAYKNTPPNHQYNTSDMIPIFQSLLDLQKTFYSQLVGSLGVTANLIDADGD